MTTLKRALEFCLSPVGLLTILLVVGLMMTAYRKTAKSGRRLVWAGVWVFLLFLLTPLAEVLTANLERPFPPVEHVDGNAGIRHVVVLSSYGEDRPGVPVTSALWPDTLSRVVEGIRLYRQLPGAKLIMSGGVLRTGDRPISTLMGDFAIALGVPREDVSAERISLTTYENLREVQKIVGDKPFVLVTSASHLWRSVAVARKLGMRPVPAPAELWAAPHFPAGMPWKAFGWKVLESAGPSTTRFTHLQVAWHEYLGYAWYWVLRRV
jgi:uncharacterized SAM-binding protein YcdF (DUF218 family)